MATDDADRDDDESRDRYRELLEELRTILPGAQVLLGFLLTVPFASRFEDVDGTGRFAFALALATVAAATVLFLAPAAHHRIADDVERSRRIRFGVRTQLAGLALLAVSVTLGLFVVVRFLYDWRAASSIAGAIAVLSVVVWLVRPMIDRRRAHRDG